MTVVYLPECCLSELAISISLFAAVAERIIELLDQRPTVTSPAHLISLARARGQAPSPSNIRAGRADASYGQLVTLGQSRRRPPSHHRATRGAGHPITHSNLHPQGGVRARCGGALGGPVVVRDGSVG